MNSYPTSEYFQVFKNAAAEYFAPLFSIVRFFKELSSLDSNLKKISEEHVKVEEQYIYLNNLFKDINRMHAKIDSIENKLSREEKELENAIETLNHQLALNNALNKSIHEVNWYSAATHLSMHKDAFLPSKPKIARLVKSNYELITRQLEPGTELTPMAAEIGLATIEYVLSRMRGDCDNDLYLFGVNVGGEFIANWLIQRMKIHQKYKVKLDINPDIDNKKFIENREIGIGDTIVILDDVVRTGNTLKTALETIQKNYPNTMVYTMALVVSCVNGEENCDPYSDVDYTPWVTYNSDVMLPWTKQHRDSKKTIEATHLIEELEIDQWMNRIKSCEYLG